MSTIDSPFNETPNVSNTQVALRFGVITTVVLIVYGLIGFVSGLTDPSKMSTAVSWINSLITYAVMIGGVVMAVRHHRDENQKGFITFGKAFGTGFKTTLVICITQAIWLFVFMSFIAPDMMDQILQASIDKAAEQGQDPEQVEAGMKMMSWMFTPPMMAVMAFITLTFMGTIFSLIVAAVMKKDQEKF